MFQKKGSEKQRTRNEMQFEVKRYNTITGRNGFTYKAARSWNSIPDRIKATDITQTFKKRLKAVHQPINDFTSQKNKEKDVTYY